jgi:hypothetical protein
MTHALPSAIPTAISFEDDHATHTAAGGEDAADGDDVMVASGLHPSSQS